MSLRTSIGAIGNLLDEPPEHCRRVAMPHARCCCRATSRSCARCAATGFRVGTLSSACPIAERRATGSSARSTRCAARPRGWCGDGTRSSCCPTAASTRRAAPIPIAARHRRRALPPGARGRAHACAAWWSSRASRARSMHFALLLGYGAAAVMPVPGVRLDRGAARRRRARRADGRRGAGALRQGVGKGLLKMLLEDGHLDRSRATAARRSSRPSGSGRGWSTATSPAPSRASAASGCDVHAADAAARHARRRSTATAARRRRRVPVPRRAASTTPGTPTRSSQLQRAVRDDELRDASARTPRRVDEARRRRRRCAACSSCVPAGAADAARRGRAVEPRSCSRFATGAMTPRLDLERGARDARDRDEPHRRRARTPARAARIRARSTPDANGDLRRSAIKQVASARFGVTAGYLVDADQLQIKVAQGAKPGEGGQLPGHKVDATDRAAAPLDARRRPDLAAAAPRHLLDRGPGAADPRPAYGQPGAPRSRSSWSPRPASAPSPPASPRPKADHIVIAGHDGGTGASPAVVAQARRPAVGARPRRDAAGAGRERPARPRAAAGRRRPAHRRATCSSAALLGAEEFAFSTAPLVAAGCVMMRVCHLNTCPVGIATQDPELRRRFTGTPEHVVTLLPVPGRGACASMLAALGAALARRARRPRRPAAPARRAEPGSTCSAAARTRAAVARAPRAARRAQDRRARRARRPLAAGRRSAPRSSAASRSSSTPPVAQHRPQPSARCSRARSRAARPDGLARRHDRAAAARHRRPELRRVRRRAA